MELTQSEKDRIVSELEARGATLPCPRCGNGTFAVVGGYFNHFIQASLSGVNLGGPSIPTAVVVCAKCGWVAEHALGTLGLLPTENSAGTVP